MVKFRATKKEIQEGYWKVFQVGYCGISSIARVCSFDARAYSAGRDGWNWDCYEITTAIAIISGYKKFGKKIPNVEEWEKEARELKNKSQFDRDYKKKAEDFKKRFIACLENTI